MNSDEEYSLYFGKPLSAADSKVVFLEFSAKFRQPFSRSDISTHGSIWSNFQGEVINSTLEDSPGMGNDEVFVLVERRKSNIVFRCFYKQFESYLQNREDGYLAPIYAYSKNNSTCVCQNGENGSMKPVQLIYVNAK